MTMAVLNTWLTPEVVAFLTAWLVSSVIVLTQRWHGKWSVDSLEGIQKFHTQPTPRVGGIAIVIGAVSAWGVVPQADVSALLGPLLLAGLPALVFGLTEDLTKRVGVGARLLATMACGVMGYAMTGMAITHANLVGLDWLLGFTVVSVVFTAFAVAGVANAVNIIDGMNGLAGGSVVIMLAGLGAISLQLGDPQLAHVCVILAAAVAGFLLVNWPLGRIFLGDGGAYCAGCALAWVSVLLMAHHPEVSAWAPLLACGYPILEVLFSMQRRWRRGLSVSAPDRLHLHSLVKKRVVARWFPGAGNLARNSITGALMWLAALVPVGLAIFRPTDTAFLVLALLVCALLYTAVYARLTQFSWCIGAATMRAARADQSQDD